MAQADALKLCVLPRCLAVRVAAWLLRQEKEVAPIIADYWEHAAFPYELVPRIAKLNLGGATIKGHGWAPPLSWSYIVCSTSRSLI